MAVSALPQAPFRQDRKLFPTPLIGDVLFSEVRDCTRIEFPEYGTPHPDTKKWPDHFLVFIQPIDVERNEIFTFFYAAKRESQDLYNWEFADANIGGTNFPAVTRSYVTLRSEYDPSGLPMGSLMPDSPKGKFTAAYVLAERVQKKIGQQELDSMFVVEQHVYVNKSPFIQNSFDEYFGLMLQSKQTLYYATEEVADTELTAAELFADKSNTYWGLQSTGVARDGKQQTANWYVISEQEVIPPALASGSRSYWTSENYGWPSVVSSIRVETWERRDGGAQRYMVPVFSRNAYNGPCKALVIETWSKTPPAESLTETMQPLRIDFSTPYFAINIGPSLHAAQFVSFTNGAADPVFTYNIANFSTQATSPTDWPSSIIAADQVKPFRGGYLRQLVRVYQPD